MQVHFCHSDVNVSEYGQSYFSLISAISTASHYTNSDIIDLKWYRHNRDSIPRLNAHLDGAAMAVGIGHGDADEAGTVRSPEAVGGEGRRHQRPAIDHPE